MEDALRALPQTAEDAYALVQKRIQEGVQLDFKSKIDSSATKTLVAMANTAGGVVIFGVDAPKNVAEQVTPIDLTDAAERLANLARGTDEPLVLANTLEIPLEDDRSGVLVGCVHKSDRRPHLVGGCAYLRSGPTDRKMTVHELGAVFASRPGFASEFALATGKPAQVTAYVDSTGRDKGQYWLVFTNNGEATAHNVQYEAEPNAPPTMPEPIPHLAPGSIVRFPLSPKMGGRATWDMTVSWQDEEGVRHSQPCTVSL